MLALIPPRNARVMFPTSQSADPVQLAARSFSNPNQKEEDLTVFKSYLSGLKRHFWKMPGEAISRILENVRVCRNDHLWHPVIRHCTLWETGADCEHNIKLVSTSEKCQCLLFVWIFILLFTKYQTSFPVNICFAIQNQVAAAVLHEIECFMEMDFFAAGR